VANVTVLDRRCWGFADVAASVDAVVAKTGYGIVAACIANGLPLIYLRRDGFAEHPYLAEGLESRGLGFEIAISEFERGNWAPHLAAAANCPNRGKRSAADGAARIVDTLAAFMT
jgi:UDP:flavonoid glycosyltransferase YjiC (YdhE family)